MLKPQHLWQSRRHRQIARHFYRCLVLRGSVTWRMGHPYSTRRPYMKCWKRAGLTNHAASFKWHFAALQAIQLYPAIFWKQHKDRKQQTDRTHGSLGKYFGDLLEPSLNILRSKFAPKSSAKKQLKFVFQKKTPLSITSFTSIFYIDLPFTSFLPFHLDRRRLRIPSRHRTTAHLTGLVVQRNNLIRVLGCAKKKGEIYETQKKKAQKSQKMPSIFLAYPYVSASPFRRGQRKLNHVGSGTRGPCHFITSLCLPIRLVAVVSLRPRWRSRWGPHRFRGPTASLVRFI